MPSLLENQRDILDAIKQLAFDACCPDLPFQPTPDQTTDLTPHEGPAPETWGSEPVADWADWELLVCGAAGAWVDLQVDNARTMQTLLNVGAITVAVIVGFFAVFSLTAISLGTAASIWGGLATLYGTQVFSQAADAMELQKDRIICAIKGEYTNDLRATMQEILPVLSWTGWYQFQAYENIENTIWEGGNPNQGDLTVYRSACPDCENLPPVDADAVWLDFFGSEPNIIHSCDHARWNAWYQRNDATKTPVPDSVRIVDGFRCSDNQDLTGNPAGTSTGFHLIFDNVIGSARGQDFASDGGDYTIRFMGRTDSWQSTTVKMMTSWGHNANYSLNTLHEVTFSNVPEGNQFIGFLRNSSNHQVRLCIARLGR
jgi:hypothetical protein